MNKGGKINKIKEERDFPVLFFPQIFPRTKDKEREFENEIIERVERIEEEWMTRNRENS